MPSEIKLQQSWREKKNKKWFVVAGLSLLLTGSVLVSHLLNKKAVTSEVLESQRTELDQQISQIRDLAQDNPQQAHLALSLVEQETGEVQGVWTDSLRQQIREVYQEIYHTQELSVERLDLPWPTDQLRLSPFGDEGMGIMSSVKGSLGRVSSEGRVEIGTENASLIGASHLAVSTDGWFVYQSDTGLWYFSDINSDGESVISQAGQWGQVKDIAAYLDNVYILSPQLNQVAKYPGLGNGRLAGSSAYFEDPVVLDNAMDIEIDGHVYVLYQGGRIEKFLGGRRTDFQLHGIHPPLDQASNFVTGVDFAHLYLLTENSILVFTVDGEYVRQLNFNQGQIKDFMVDANEEWIYLVVDDGLVRAQL